MVAKASHQTKTRTQAHPKWRPAARTFTATKGNLSLHQSPGGRASEPNGRVVEKRPPIFTGYLRSKHASRRVCTVHQHLKRILELLKQCKRCGFINSEQCCRLPRSFSSILLRDLPREQRYLSSRLPSQREWQFSHWYRIHDHKFPESWKYCVASIRIGWRRIKPRGKDTCFVSVLLRPMYEENQGQMRV
jgi:hypothetical protein